jgi:DNA-directed RNA polymerase subunit RPC12/RpoP
MSEDTALVCPRCGSKNIDVFYTAPPQFQCRKCGAKLFDENAEPAIRVLTIEQGHRKRPALYGEPICSCCTHAPHDGSCEFCDEIKKPHVYKLVAV